ncbi:hypothetical protein F4781DRAFT_380730 [Annulohypoxylon bovei var. microspora]|nr:hypothetical protein F4781DRAFT_380730 [Annulohypoxylon bovei var. microspora]
MYPFTVRIALSFWAPTQHLPTWLFIYLLEKPYKKKGKKRTYNTGDSLVVTDPTTGPAVFSLSKGERTGSRVF